MEIFSVKSKFKPLEEVNTLTTERFSETRPFMHLSMHVFQSQLLQKYLNYEANFSKKNVSNLMYIPKMQ